MTVLLNFLSEILPGSVLTYILVRGKIALFASVVLYTLYYCCEFYFAAPAGQGSNSGNTFSVVSSWAGVLSGGTAEVASGHGRTAMATGACTSPMQSCKAHATSLTALVAIISRPEILDPSHISDAKRHLKPVINTGFIQQLVS